MYTRKSGRKKRARKSANRQTNARKKSTSAAIHAALRLQSARTMQFSSYTSPTAIPAVRQTMRTASCGTSFI